MSEKFEKRVNKKVDVYSERAVLGDEIYNELVKTEGFDQYYLNSELDRKTAMICWFFTDNPEEAKNFFEKNRSRPVFNDNPDKVIHFLSNVMGKYKLSEDDVLDIYETVYDADLVEPLLNFEKKYRISDYVKNVPKGQVGGKWVIINLIQAWTEGEDSDYRIEIVIYVLSHTLWVDMVTINSFFSDLSLRYCVEILKKIINLSFDAEVSGVSMDKVSNALKIGRNLYLKGVSLEAVKNMTVDDLKNEYLEITDLQSKFKDIPLFRGRKVVLLRNNEKWGDVVDSGNINGEDRFGDETMQKKLKDSIGSYGSLEVYGTDSNVAGVDELRAVKEKVIFAIKNTPPPFTFVFDGHGGPNHLCFNVGKLKDGVPVSEKEFETLSSQEMADAIFARSEKFKDNPALVSDIFIFQGCFGNNFIRNIIARNSGMNIPQPIMIAASEYGQYTFNGGENDGIYTVLKVGDKNPTVGDVLDLEQRYKISDYTVYVPNMKSVSQIAGNAQSKEKLA